MNMTSKEFVAEVGASVANVSPDEAEELIEQGALILDVREAGEYEAGHLTDAINLPRGLLEFKIDKVAGLEKRTRSVLVYCQTGGRGALASYTLGRMGFENVSNLDGGYAAWLEQGKPTQEHLATWTG